MGFIFVLYSQIYFISYLQLLLGLCVENHTLTMQKFVCVYMYISRTAEWIGMKFGIHVDYTLDNHIGYFLFEYRVTAGGSWFMIKLKDKMRLGRSPAFHLRWAKVTTWIPADRRRRRSRPRKQECLRRFYQRQQGIEVSGKK